MACLDFDHSKKFLVFLACANPRFFKNYVKLDQPPSTITSYPSSGSFYLDNFEEAADYREAVYPTYLHFVPPTSRFPGGPPQLRRSYPPPKPPSPVIVDAVPKSTSPVIVDAAPKEAPPPGGSKSPSVIVRDVTPPPGQPSAKVSTRAGSPKSRKSGHAFRSTPHPDKLKGSTSGKPAGSPSRKRRRVSRRGKQRSRSRSGSETSEFHVSLRRLRTRLRAVLRRIHPLDAMSSVGNLRYYSSSGMGLV